MMPLKMPASSPPHAFAPALLVWYDRHRRDLPWRARPGAMAEPYAVWLSEIMLQQTTVEAVKPYFHKFLALWPNVTSLAAAEDAAVFTAWAGLGYYARARNLLACARTITKDHGGRFPHSEAALLALPGIGAYTAAAIAAIAFNRRAVVVDGNVERVITRVFALETPLPAAKPAIRALLDPLTPQNRPGDFAQAMMDLGATICTPKTPACALCPLTDFCQARKTGRMSDFPVKAMKKPRPIRYGTAFLAYDDKGRLLLRTRPPKGLLANMAEIPTSDWLVAESTGASPPFPATWQRLNGEVRHVFTHFELRLGVMRALNVPATTAPPSCRWVARDALAQEPLPTLMKKVIAVGDI